MRLGEFPLLLLWLRQLLRSAHPEYSSLKEGQEIREIGHLLVVWADRALKPERFGEEE